MAAEVTGKQQRRWRFAFDYLPPGVNHQYKPIGKQGQKALTEDAKETRERIANEAFVAGFRPRLEAAYAVRVVFVMPGWGQDIDSPVKALLDAVFDTRRDHRVIRLEVDKRVEPGVRRTEVEIEEVTAPMQPGERAVPVQVTSYRDRR